MVTAAAAKPTVIDDELDPVMASVKKVQEMNAAAAPAIGATPAATTPAAAPSASAAPPAATPSITSAPAASTPTAAPSMTSVAPVAKTSANVGVQPITSVPAPAPITTQPAPASATQVPSTSPTGGQGFVVPGSVGGAVLTAPAAPTTSGPGAALAAVQAVQGTDFRAMAQRMTPAWFASQGMAQDTANNLDVTSNWLQSAYANPSLRAQYGLDKFGAPTAAAPAASTPASGAPDYAAAAARARDAGFFQQQGMAPENANNPDVINSWFKSAYADPNLRAQYGLDKYINAQPGTSTPGPNAALAALQAVQAASAPAAGSVTGTGAAQQNYDAQGNPVGNPFAMSTTATGPGIGSAAGGLYGSEPVITTSNNSTPAQIAAATAQEAAHSGSPLATPEAVALANSQGAGYTPDQVVHGGGVSAESQVAPVAPPGMQWVNGTLGPAAGTGGVGADPTWWLNADGTVKTDAQRAAELAQPTTQRDPANVNPVQPPATETLGHGFNESVTTPTGGTVAGAPITDLGGYIADHNGTGWNPGTGTTTGTGSTPTTTGPNAAMAAVAAAQAAQAGSSGAGTAPSVTSFGPGNDLIGSQITPGQDTATQSQVNAARDSLSNAPDRKTLANQIFTTLRDQSDPAYQQSVRGAVQNAAKYGRIGAGMTTNKLNDIWTERQHSLDQTASLLGADAAGLTLSDNINRLNATAGLEGQRSSESLANANQLAGERGYQNSLAEQAVNDFIKQQESQQSVANSEAARDNDKTRLLLSAAFGGDAQLVNSLLGASANTSANNSSSSNAMMQAVMNWIIAQQGKPSTTSTQPNTSGGDPWDGG